MSLLRLVFLIAIAGFLVIFTLSNWGVAMPLVFLGGRSPAFPLPLWILGAIALGVATTLVITALFGLARFTARRSERRSVRSQATQPPSSYTSRPATPEDASDWFDDDDDWGEEPRRQRDFEAPQAPKSGTRSGSTYSYSYREPSPPKPPDVVDAEYRVIVPPSRDLDDDEVDDRRR